MTAVPQAETQTRTTRPHAFSWRRRKLVRQVARYTAAVLITIVFLFPVYWLFTMAFKTPEEVFSSPPTWIPASITFDSFALLFRDGDVAAVGNSLIIAGTSTAIAMVFGTMCAYSLARFRTGGDHLALWIISQRMIPPITIVFPLFLLYAILGWRETRTTTPSSRPTASWPAPTIPT